MRHMKRFVMFHWRLQSLPISRARRRIEPIELLVVETTASICTSRGDNLHDVNHASLVSV